ncbi:MAG: glycosyltransferase family 4 protein [Rickettsiales bacterium]|jgi:glycosyltransferase involved in cell wall biosynthesis|nr:glycosyltransferase family 4 protein [Rickettsiales bacterium]
MNKKIAVILPRVEGFSYGNFGAVALCVQDNCLFSKYKDDIVVFGGKTKSGKSYDNINYRYIKTNRLKHLTFSKNKAFAKELLLVLKREKFALIEVHNKVKVAEFLSRDINIPIAQHLHNDINDDVKSINNQKFRLKTIAYSQHVYCVSDFVRRRLLEGIEEFGAKASVVYNGLDPDAFLKFRSQEKLNRIIFIGRITKEKGALAALLAVNQLFMELDGWEMVMIGSYSKKYHDYVDSFNEALTIHPDRVKHYPQMEFDKAMEYVGSSKIAVLPSHWEEPFGRTVLESILCEVAVVTCRSGGISEICEENSLYAEKYNIASLITNIKRLIDDELLREEKIRASFQHASEKFNIRVTTKKLDDIRDNLLKELDANAG